VAIAVGQTELKRVIRYIKNQENHYRKKSYQEELDYLIVWGLNPLAG
jgi:hypothetical protein